MKSILRKFLSAALAAAILAAPAGVYASDALGHDLAAKSTVLNAGTELADGVFWSDSRSDFRKENYIVYSPNERVTPLVTCGDTTRALTSVPAQAQALEAQGLRVVAGMNGDYYGLSHGVPLGTTMSDGRLRNANHDDYYAVGFRADGTAVIGNPNIRLRTLVNGAGGPEIFAFNHVRQSDYGIFLYDHDFNDRHTTGTSEPGVDVVCSVVDGALTLDGTLELVVDEVLGEATDTPVDADKFVLTANRKAGDAYTAPLLALQPGDRLTVRAAAEGYGDWSGVRNLIGAPELLVENGAVRDGLPTGSAPRTAIGQRADGSLVFYTIDGRQSGYSVGATLTAVAMRLVELGCVTAVALDGGGSTTLVATMPHETAARVVNTPSDSPIRAVSNHVFLVAQAAPSGTPDHVYLAPESTKGLPGAKVALTAAVVDTNYIPVAAGRALTYSVDAGSVDENGVLTLPGEIGTVHATASYGALSATVAVEVTAPDAILFKQDGATVWSLTIPPESDAALNAVGILNHLPLAGGNDCFEWTFEGSGVTLLPDGYTLRAGKDAGAGTLTVSAAGKTASLPVTVATVPHKTGADFEAAFEQLASGDGKTTLSHNTAAAYVHNGRGSARLDYAAVDPSDEDAFAASVAPVNYPIPSGCDTYSLWYLAEQPSAFEFVFDNGERASVEYRADASGWQIGAGKVPSGAKAVVGVAGHYAVETGTVWLDQLVFSRGFSMDETAPEVSLSLDAEAGALTGFAFDAMDGAALQTLRLTYDGAALEFAGDSRTGTLSAALPAYDGAAHYVTLTAGDASGNLARASILIPAAADAEPAFPDAAGHWAAGYIGYLKRAGVSNGNGDGLYLPDANISRQEFATMLYRYLAPEGSFDDVKLPFVDADKIGNWALDAARAMYRLGIINGSLGSDGKLRYDPQSSITRQEAVTMLGRLLEKGYAAPALSYADSAEIPAWAAEHVSRLASFGVFDDFASDSFAPTRALTRAEMAAMLLRLK